MLPILFFYFVARDEEKQIEEAPRQGRTGSRDSDTSSSYAVPLHVVQSRHVTGCSSCSWAASFHMLPRTAPETLEVFASLLKNWDTCEFSRSIVYREPTARIVPAGHANGRNRDISRLQAYPVLQRGIARSSQNALPMVCCRAWSRLFRLARSLRHSRLP